MSNQTNVQPLEINVGGMDCAGCVSSVEKALKSLDGVSDIRVSLAENKAAMTIDTSKVSVDAIKEAIEDAGYEAA